MLLNAIREKLQSFPPLLRQPAAQGSLREAAVLMAMTRSENPDLIFIKRAEHLNSHRGQVAFPGGMWEPGDASLLHTALRESEEEIALLPDQVEVIAALKPMVTRFRVRVSPYVGFIPQGLEFVPELSELDAVFPVPLSVLIDPRNVSRTHRHLAGKDYWVPCINYGQYCIWGFTLHLLADFLNHTHGLVIPLDYQLKDGN